MPSYSLKSRGLSPSRCYPLPALQPAGTSGPGEKRERERERDREKKDDDVVYLFLQKQKLIGDKLHVPLGRYVP
jgi:hypothetical protein